MKKVYLSGPISGRLFGDAAHWREYAARRLQEIGIKAVSPLRFKEYLANEGPLSKRGYERHPLSTPRGVTTRDRYDCTTADLVLVNLLHAGDVSIGTVMEIAWADAFRIPIVLIMEDQGNPHEHLILNEVCGFV